jgi:hypothetical protein
VGWFPEQETKTLRSLWDEVGRMLTTMRRKLRESEEEIGRRK